MRQTLTLTCFPYHKGKLRHIQIVNVVAVASPFRPQYAALKLQKLYVYWPHFTQKYTYFAVEHEDTGHLEKNCLIKKAMLDEIILADNIVNFLICEVNCRR
jgi:hypothetical protein